MAIPTVHDCFRVKTTRSSRYRLRQVGVRSQSSGCPDPVAFAVARRLVNPGQSSRDAPCSVGVYDPNDQSLIDQCVVSSFQVHVRTPVTTPSNSRLTVVHAVPEALISGAPACRCTRGTTR